MSHSGGFPWIDQKDVHSRHMGEGVLTPGSRAGSTLTATTWRRMCYLISRGGRTTQPPRRAETQAGWPALPQAWWKRLIGRGQLRGCLNSGQWSEKVRMSPEWPIPHRDTCTMSAQAPSVPTRIDLEGGWTGLTGPRQREVCVCGQACMHSCAPATQCGQEASSETNTLHVLYQICRCHTAVGDDGK